MCILQTRSYWKWGPMRLKLEVFEMQKCNISTDRAQRKDEQNRVIHLVMFTPSFRVIKMSKMVQFMYLLLNTAKISLERILKCNLKILFSPFWKYYGLCSFELPWVKFHHLKIQDLSTSLLTQQFFKYLFSISQKKSKAYYTYHFWKNSIRSSTFLNIVPILWQIFCCYQQILAISDIFKTITLGVTMITR